MHEKIIRRLNIAALEYANFFLDRDGMYHLSAEYSTHSLAGIYLRGVAEYEPKTIEEYRELIGSVEVSQMTTYEPII